MPAFKPEEDAAIRQMLADGASYTKIGRTIHRRRDSVRDRARLLGLIPPAPVSPIDPKLAERIRSLILDGYRIMDVMNELGVEQIQVDRVRKGMSSADKERASVVRTQRLRDMRAGVGGFRPWPKVRPATFKADYSAENADPATFMVRGKPADRSRGHWRGTPATTVATQSAIVMAAE